MKFRRKKSTQTEASPAEASPSGTSETTEPPEGPHRGARSEGPWDASEVEIDTDDPTRIDLGGLVLTARPGLELRLQVDEASQQVVAVLLVGKEGAVELRPFAAPRNADLWDDIRPQIAAETSRRGGTATEADGVFGKELRVVMPVTTPDGKSGTQPSRVMGIAGPRWLLRATYLGRPAVTPAHDGDIESALRDVVVVRGSAPMAPGEPLPLVMPAGSSADAG